MPSEGKAAQDKIPLGPVTETVAREALHLVLLSAGTLATAEGPMEDPQAPPWGATEEF